ncbi:Gfo/Idh/MocA family oxidoreductase [Haloarcula sp. S1CR25-12]|uniref:Gfo/Idh/MocA family oxidoreductase n=1 Tax=Haloarcula saliterrae TaxID=2950534 RepID=A0ABU2F8L2_9EURY|nr:Gfo/Idh/MocA family oxidoreductase [Haloarcula sp. S1CR25-12]MDS0258628.1 Gfo/Idh/MocA family oxidoreductase [Haloarcula sp. S1CR25-12]
MNEEHSIDLGFIGLGNIARLHCDRLQKAGHGDLVTAGLDVEPEARARFAAQYDTTVYEEQSELYDAVDAVLVTTPNKFHEEYVVSALEAGLDVFVEKPLAHTVGSAERIAAAARDAEGFCMVGFHNRFRNPVQALLGYRDDGTMGDIGHIEANYIRRRGVPGRGSWFTRKALAGGGSLIDIGVHAIDLSLFLLGFPEVVEVSGQTRANFGSRTEYSYVTMWGEDHGSAGFDVDDSASALIRCANGVTISLEVAWATNRPDSQEYVVRGSEAGARLDLSDDKMELYETVSTGVDHHRTSEIETAGDDAHGIELERFVDSVAAGEPPGVNTVEQALTVQRVLDAIYRSSTQGRAVTLEE